ncbi:hypothetical protein PN473_05730, partial [Dolichospermum circinale CS-545/17]|nr:hypothetical protein [Dolichospermum circinale CS-545/17]
SDRTSFYLHKIAIALHYLKTSDRTSTSLHQKSDRHLIISKQAIALSSYLQLKSDRYLIISKQAIPSVSFAIALTKPQPKSDRSRTFHR